MVSEMRAIWLDGNERDARHAAVLGHFSQVNSGLAESIRLGREASGLKAEGLKHRLLEVASDLLSYVATRQIQDPVFNQPTVTLPYDFQESMRRSNEQMNKQMDYTVKTGQLYAATFPPKIRPLLNEAEKLGKKWDGTLYEGNLSLSGMQMVARAL